MYETVNGQMNLEPPISSPKDGKRVRARNNLKKRSVSLTIILPATAHVINLEQYQATVELFSRQRVKLGEL